VFYYSRVNRKDRNRLFVEPIIAIVNVLSEEDASVSDTSKAHTRSASDR
jgi:hypothetical protein